MNAAGNKGFDCWRSLVLFVLLTIYLRSSAVPGAWAGSVTTLDGKRIEGAVSVDSKSSLLVTPKNGTPTRVDLANVLHAQMDVANGDDLALTRGVVLSDGAALAAATFRRADADTIKLVPMMMNAEVTIKAVRIARIVFGSLSPDALAKVAGGSSGVLLESGDFVEGEFAGLENGKIKISSVLFGIQSFEAGRPGKAVVLRDAKPPSGDVIVRLVDGSVLPASAVSLDRNTTQIEKTPFGTISVGFDQIAQISAGGERIVSLRSLKSSGSSRSMGNIEPVRLLGLTRSTGTVVHQAPASTLAYDLNGDYESFIAEVGVPSQLVPTQRVRICVLGDGKELFRSDERTSVDDCLAVATSVQGVNTLTLKIESSGPGAPVVWVDPILVKKMHKDRPPKT